MRNISKVEKLFLNEVKNNFKCFKINSFRAKKKMHLSHGS